MSPRKEKAAAEDPAAELGRGVFTDYVRSLDPEDPSAVPAGFEELWEVLRTVLRNRLRLRGLWAGPPNRVGVLGWSTWQEPEAGRASKPSDALDELAVDCYSYIFLRRLRGLKAQLLRKANIDGYLFTNVDNFLYERQRAHDRLGYRVYEVVSNALEASAAAGDLYVLSGDTRIRNDSLLGFSEKAPENDRGLLLEELDGLVRRWNDDLLPGLVTAQGAERKEIEEELRRRLPELRSSGIEAFRFRQLIDPLKQDVRARWAGLFEGTGGELALEETADGLIELVRLAYPDPSVDERDSVAALADCVGLLLRGEETPATSGADLGRLWQALLILVAEPGEMKVPSQVKMARLLGIRRQRLPGLYASLGGLVTRCREGLRGSCGGRRRPALARFQAEDGR